MNVRSGAEENCFKYDAQKRLLETFLNFTEPSKLIEAKACFCMLHSSHMFTKDNRRILTEIAKSVIEDISC